MQIQSKIHKNSDQRSWKYGIPLPLKKHAKNLSVLWINLDGGWKPSFQMKVHQIPTLLSFKYLYFSYLLTLLFSSNFSLLSLILFFFSNSSFHLLYGPNSTPTILLFKLLKNLSLSLYQQLHHHRLICLFFLSYLVALDSVIAIDGIKQGCKRVGSSQVSP